MPPTRGYLKRSYGWLGVLGLTAALELVVRSGLLARRHFPPPIDVFQSLASLLRGTAVWADLGSTVTGWALGFGLALVFAVPLGIAVGSQPLVHRSLRVPLEFLRPIPTVALAPFIVLIYGTGLEGKVVFVFLGSLWPMLIQTTYGVRSLDPLTAETARALRLRPLARLVWITVPAAIPYIATGMRITSSVALTLAVTAEIVVGTGADGLGRSIDLASEGGAVELMYALILVTGVLGLILNVGFAGLERRALRWHPSGLEAAR